MEQLQWILIKLKVVTYDGRYSDGRYITTGLNKKNPLSYFIVFILSIVVGLFGFYKSFVGTWKDSFK